MKRKRSFGRILMRTHLKWGTCWVSVITLVRSDISNCWNSRARCSTWQVIWRGKVSVGLVGFVLLSWFSVCRAGIACSTRFQLLQNDIDPPQGELIVSFLTPTLHLTQPYTHAHTHTGGWLPSNPTTLSLSIQLAGSMGPRCQGRPRSFPPPCVMSNSTLPKSKKM